MNIYEQLAFAVKRQNRKIGNYSEAFISVRNGNFHYNKVISDGYGISFVSYTNTSTRTETTINAYELDEQTIEKIIKNL